MTDELDTQLDKKSPVLSIPKFEFGLTSSVMIAHLEVYGLSAENIIHGRFKINIDYAKDLFSNQIPQQAEQTFEQLLRLIIEWPSQLDWPGFVEQINVFLTQWLETYYAGMLIKDGLSLCSLVTFKSHFFSTRSLQFQVFLHDLMAECTSSYEQYRFRYIQNHDTQTNLPNIHLLNHHLTAVFNNGDKYIGLLLINFKINANKPTTKSMISAELMIEMTNIIRTNVPLGGLVFQVARNEFALVVSSIENQIALELLATKLNRALEIALHTERKIYAMVPTIAGIFEQDHVQNLDAFYPQARLALEDALNSGKLVIMYHPAIKERAAIYNALERDVVAGFEANHFELFLQPIVNIQRNICINSEALLRWKNPHGVYIPPPTIIDIIYKQGLGLPFMRWLISTACRISNEINSRLGYPLKIAINLTAEDLLDRDLPHLIIQNLSLWDVKAEDLTLEITEGGLLVDEELAHQVMLELVNIGCPLAIDDFGTGYSSMSRLRNMPISSVKIDQSFVRNVAHSDTDKTIVKSMATLAQGLNKDTVAEGVEDIACLEIIQSMGCTKVQGFHYSRPLPSENCVAWVKEFNGDRIFSH